MPIYAIGTVHESLKAVSLDPWALPCAGCVGPDVMTGMLSMLTLSLLRHARKATRSVSSFQLSLFCVFQDQIFLRSLNLTVMAGLSLLRSLAVLSLFCGGAFSQTTDPSSPTSSASSGAATCTSAVSPSGLPTNCGGRAASATFIGVWNDTCGVQYSVYCHAESYPQASDITNATSISACMANCDNYVFSDGSRCQSATLYQGKCYVKKSFDGFNTATTDTTVMIRNSNQNLLLAASSSGSTTAAPVSSTSTRTIQTSSTPSQCWNPTPTCSAGLSNNANNPSDLGGRYYDPAYGALWNVQCAQGSSNTAYFGSWSTNGQGIYACWKGCEKRIGCTAISFDSTNYQQTSMIVLVPVLGPY